MIVRNADTERPTAREIARWIIHRRFNRNWLMPNITPQGWFECDVLELTKAYFFREYEIKVTRSDFFADRKKLRSVSFGETATKYSLLAKASERGPSAFYYCVPAGLVEVDEVPVWAGLIEFTKYANARGFISEATVKQAPRLHSHRRQDLLPVIRETSYWRFHRVGAVESVESYVGEFEQGGGI